MKTKLLLRVFIICILAVLFSTPKLNAQLDRVFENVFNAILGEKGALTPEPVTSPGAPEGANHGNHYRPAAEAANNVLVPALNNLIASNVSSFPLSSTSVGVSFDFSTGQPVSITESLGPIFAEKGRTLGKGKVNVGMNYNYLGFSKFRGIRTEDIRFTFTHQDVNQTGVLGDLAQESDIMDVFLDLDVNANIFAFYATVGLTKNFDFSIALPVINVSLSGDARAAIQSFTLANEGAANHHFGDLGAVSEDPDLDHVEPYDAGAFGIGDLAIRLKYAFLQERGVDLAALLDARLPTGKEEDFLGTGEANIRLMGIVSKKIGDFTPHLNLGYDYRRAEYDSDELEFAVGFDHKITRGVTFALDILGEIDLNEENALLFEYSQEPIVIVDQVKNPEGDVIGTLTRNIEQTNVPSRLNDNVFNTAIGMRYAPAENIILLGNILLPLNDGGLRSDVAYTVGFAVSL